MAVVAGSNGRKLQKRSVRSDGWTRARRALFLAEFAATCNTRASAAKAGMSERSVRALCRRDPQFAALCEEALQDGYRRLEAELLARALGEQPDDENPLPAECEPQPPSPRFDPQMAVKVLQLRNAGASARGHDRRGRVFVRATQEETDAALMKKLEAVERRLKAVEAKHDQAGE